MYQITVVLTCDGKDCDNQIIERTHYPIFDDGIQEIREKLRSQGVNLGVALCPKCINKSLGNIIIECECDICRKRRDE